jgi:hypothetical protein
MAWSRTLRLALGGLVGWTGCIGESTDDSPVEPPANSGESDDADSPPMPCNGDSAATWLSILPPEPPRADVAAPGFVWTEVHDTKSLQQAVEDGARHIRLADGFYDEGELVGDALQLRGQQLWAANFGRARLGFGVQAGGNDDQPGRHRGSELHGLVFDIQDLAHAAVGAEQSAAIMAWGDATDLVLEDLVVDGHGVLTSGVFVTSADGLELARVRVADVRQHGVFVAGPTPHAAAEISDLHITGVDDGDDSILGIGMRLASPAHVRRIFVRDVRFAAIATVGESEGTTLAHVDIDRIGFGDPVHGGVGVYFDDTTRDTVLEHFCVGADTKIAVNSEWDHHTPDNQGHPKGLHNVVRHGLSQAWYIGVHFDQGTVHGQVHDVVFRNYQRAGIVFHRNVSHESKWPDYDDGSHQHDNAFEVLQVDCEVCDVSFTAWNHPGPVRCIGGAKGCGE